MSSTNFRVVLKIKHSDWMLQITRLFIANQSALFQQSTAMLRQSLKRKPNSPVKSDVATYLGQLLLSSDTVSAFLSSSISLFPSPQRCRLDLGNSLKQIQVFADRSKNRATQFRREQHPGKNNAAATIYNHFGLILT